MSFPLKNSYKSRQGLCHIAASDLNTIANMLNGLRVDVVQGLSHGEVLLDADESLVLRVPGPPSLTIPEPPETGRHVLMAVNGALSWVELEEFACPEVE